ncbi:MAG: PKD domain-containing protein [Candidatus Bipolaricaulota bacterium]|nr:PKD domain-containing protein [Candidatus Bipolaricaulota bacterium]
MQRLETHTLGRVVGLIGLAVLGWGWLGIGQAVITPPPAPPPASPGDALTLPFRVKNISPTRDTFDFSLEISVGLEPLGTPEPVELEPNAEETVFVSIFVSIRARAGEGSVTLKARSRKNPSLTSQASVTVTVKESPGLELIAPPAKTVEPGSVETLVFLVRNRGNVPDRVAFSAQSALRVRAPTDEISLDVGERREILIEVSVPKDTPPVRQRVTLQAISKRFANVSAEATAVLEVLPPLPHEVGGSLFLTIPSQIQSQFDGQTGFIAGAFVAIRESGGALLPDRPAVRLAVGGTLTLGNTSAGTITITVSDGRPPLSIPAGASGSFVFPVSGIFSVTVSNGALISSSIIVTVQDIVFRQTLSGRGTFFRRPAERAEYRWGPLPDLARGRALGSQGARPQDEENRISYILDIQNLFELNTLLFALDVKPVGFAIGDLYLPVNSLATLSGRGGQVTLRPGLTRFSLAAVAAQRTLTEAELFITDDPADLPASVTVSLNQPIRFRNVGLAPHTVTIAGSGTITLSPGQSFVHLFSTVGQITVTIDTTPVVFTVIAEAFCSASFLFCVGAEGQGSFLPGVTVGQAVLVGSSSSLTTTLLSTIRWQIPGGSATTVEGGLTLQDGSVRDSALRMGSELRMGDFLISAQVVRAGRDFVGDRRDEQGIAIFQAFSTTNFSLGLSFERVRNNVANDPLQQTLTRQQARAFLSLKLSEILPTFRISTVYSTLVGLGPLPPTDLSRFSFTIQATQPIGKLGAISVFTEQARVLNAIAATDTGFGTVGSEFSLKLSELRASLGFEHRSEVDLLSGVLLSRSLVTAAGLELLRRPLGVRFGWTRLNDRFDLSAALQARLGIATLFFSGLIGFLDSGTREFSFALAVALQFDATIPFVVVNGRVEGFVFIDKNSNGQRDPGETGPKNLILTLGNEKARTDAQGFFRFPPMEPGTYELKIEGLPTGLIGAPPKAIRIVAGQTVKTEIPLTQVAVIEGLVFNDENRNGQLDPAEQGLGSVRVFLTDETGKTRDQRTDPEGRFAFSELLPGKYTVALDARSLPKDFSPTTPAEVTVELKAQERITVNFGAAERPRTVKFPPVADFTFSPERPKVGEAVRFDASESFDPDGQIVKYEWDFESDGTTDAQGVIVEHVFAQAGTFTVTLTVTDNDGETGTARKTITVGP